jgi:uncharacterized membrane protein YecN with MAPEG domain
MSIATPTVASAYAAFLGLLAVALTVRVILCRVKTGIQAGDGSNAQLARTIRAHGNFAEQVPLALLLIVLAEMAGARIGLIHALGTGLVIARLASAWGLSHSLGPTMPRQAGAGATALVVAGATLLITYRLVAGN